MLTEVLKSHPEVLAILVAILGFLVARLLSGLGDRFLLGLESYLRRRAPERLERLDLMVLKQVLRATLYYGTLVIFLLAALQTLSISVVEQWLTLLLQYVPQLILGGLIILTGYLIGMVARSVLASIMGVNSNHLVPRFMQLLIVTAAVLTGLAQTSIDISFISNVMVILLVFFFGGLSLSFALGSRLLVENLLARRALDRYRIGDTVRINDRQGKIIEILNTAVVLQSDEGLITLPTARFIDSEVLLVNETHVDDGSNAIG